MTKLQLGLYRKELTDSYEVQIWSFLKVQLVLGA
jgi:hypothetical protein